MIINNTYFNKGVVHIPNGEMTTRNRNQSESQTSTLDDAITTHERVLLINALNPTLWDEIESSYLSGVLQANAPQWVQDLVNGLTYTFEDKSYVWNGLASSRSPLVNYIFCKYLSDDLYTYLVRGVSKLMTNASKNVDATDLYVSQWNEFIKDYQGDAYYYDSRPKVYHNQSGMLLDYYHADSRTPFVPMLTFINHYSQLNDGTYTDVNCKLYENENKFGI